MSPGGIEPPILRSEVKSFIQISYELNFIFCNWEKNSTIQILKNKKKKVKLSKNWFFSTKFFFEDRFRANQIKFWIQKNLVWAKGRNLFHLVFFRERKSRPLATYFSSSGGKILPENLPTGWSPSWKAHKKRKRKANTGNEECSPIYPSGPEG